MEPFKPAELFLNGASSGIQLLPLFTDNSVAFELLYQFSISMGIMEVELGL